MLKHHIPLPLLETFFLSLANLIKDLLKSSDWDRLIILLLILGRIYARRPYYTEFLKLLLDDVLQIRLLLILSFLECLNLVEIVDHIDEVSR